jgi:predicted DNA-binding transcriptional regulator AlpA
MMYSVAEFCQAHRISRGTFYKLLNEGHGPTTVKIGRRTLISNESAAEWRRRLEAKPGVSGQRVA